MDYIYKLKDSDGKSFRIILDLPIIIFDYKAPRVWRTKDKGFIRYNSGKAYFHRLKGTGPDMEIFFFNKDRVTGLELYDLLDFWGLNDKGTGFLVQTWTLKMKPGKIRWALID